MTLIGAKKRNYNNCVDINGKILQLYLFEYTFLDQFPKTNH